MPPVRVITRIIVALLLPVLVGYTTVRFMKRAFMEPYHPENAEITLFEIVPGTSFRSICRGLAEKGLVRHWWSVELLTRIRKQDNKIRAGEYELSPSMTPRQILQKLISGDILKRTVLIKEGSTMVQIAEAVEQAGLVSKDEFIKAASDPMLLARVGISAPNFEGYLFPDTYYFSRPIKAQDIILAMLQEGDKRWTKEFIDQAEKLVLSRHEVLTLASIIEKESGNVDEQPIVSSVFHNRLSHGMKLQSDPTVIYGIPNFDGNLTKEHLLTPHPYNTYVNFGLPPGPIGNPGETAIKAALFPAQTTYLFFVGDGQGRHVFSTTLQEHNEAVNRYQRHPSIENVATPPQP